MQRAHDRRCAQASDVAPAGSSARSIRVRVRLTGVVQGMGVRPAVHRLARALGLAGWVANTAEGAIAEVEGQSSPVLEFLDRLRTDLPSAMQREAIDVEAVATQGEDGFRIMSSEEQGRKTLAIQPDLAPCSRCRAELENPTDRRFRYPFIACVDCGPRYSILCGLPYDRQRTTLAGFPLCESCRREYEDPADRRHHAESIACPTCGPRVALMGDSGRVQAEREAALAGALRLLEDGGILAVKGLGGFQLWVDARADSAVQRLRDRKRRPQKPFAVLFSSIAAVQTACVLSEAAAAFLESPLAPIVLLGRRPGAALAEAVAPGLRTVGAMLPSTPLHHLLACGLDFPVVATSGNRSEEPLATSEEEARERLRGIADLFLVHDRPIARPIDDSVVRWSDEGPIVVRRARGYVPLPFAVTHADGKGARVPVLGLGGHLKNTIAFAEGDRILLSQHVGDLTSLEAVRSFRGTIEDVTRVLERRPGLLACDLHPDYVSTRVAEELSARWHVPLIRVQHHHAHAVACLAEHRLTGTVLGVVWDGSGYGSDGTLWGGEFLIAGQERATRHAHLRTLRLPGGEEAMKDPRRAGLSALVEVLREDARAKVEALWPDWTKQAQALLSLLEGHGATPTTSSMGRLFDAVAALTGLGGPSTYEGQAAMLVEQAAEEFARRQRGSGEPPGGRYRIVLERPPGSGTPGLADWRPLIRGILHDVERGVDPGCIAYAFHDALAVLVERVASEAGLPRVVLSGGCFQNVVLARLVRKRLLASGFEVYGHVRLPPNDGGLAAGQVMIAAAQPVRSQE